MMMVSCAIFPAAVETTENPNVTVKPVQPTSNEATLSPEAPVDIHIREVETVDAVNITPNETFTILLCSDLPETSYTKHHSLNSVSVLDVDEIKKMIFNDNDEVEVLRDGNVLKQGDKVIKGFKDSFMHIILKSEVEYDAPTGFEESLQKAYQYASELIGYENTENIQVDLYVPKLMTVNGDEIIAGYRILFSDIYNGIPISVSVHNNFIRVFLDSRDVIQLTIKWDKFEEADEHEIVLPDSSDALALIIEDMKQYDDYYLIIDPLKIIDVQLSYSTSFSDDGVYGLVWEFYIENLPSIQVDVCSGEVYNPMNPN